MNDGAGASRGEAADVDLDPEAEADAADGGPTDGSPRADGGADLESVPIAFGEEGLVPAVAQDADSGEVLMLAYVSPAALERTLETGRAHYYSRSRAELWEKGATSGHTQTVREVRVDCDEDALLYVVEQAGGACHTGYRSCFHRTVEGVASTEPSKDTAALEGDREAGLSVAVRPDGDRAFDPDEVY
jgi:phosphoribosyl-AMP cyclohydrolase